MRAAGGAREIGRAVEDVILALMLSLEFLRLVLSYAITDISASGAVAHARDPNSERRTRVALMDIIQREDL